MKRSEYARLEELIYRIKDKDLKELFELLEKWISEKEDSPEDY